MEILILAIVLPLTVDFGRFWDCEARLKVKVATGLYQLLYISVQPTLEGK